jgi:hypothetical protein
MFHLKFDTASDAFADDPREEIARILRRVADQVEESRSYASVLDLNGNTIGSWTASS